jgi:hypothetical protein
MKAISYELANADFNAGNLTVICRTEASTTDLSAPVGLFLARLKLMAKPGSENAYI